MAIGEYTNISKERQNEIIKVAKRKRRYLSVWQQQQLAIWLRAKEKGDDLPEQQRFFMKDIEALLENKGFLCKENSYFHRRQKTCKTKTL